MNVGILAARQLVTLPGIARVVFAQRDIINSDASELEPAGDWFLAGDLYGLSVYPDKVSMTFASGTVDVLPLSLVLAVLL